MIEHTVERMVEHTARSSNPGMDSPGSRWPANVR